MRFLNKKTLLTQSQLKLCYMRNEHNKYHDWYDLNIAIDVRGFEDTNRFLSGFIKTVQKFNPYPLSEPHRCWFSQKDPIGNPYYSLKPNNEFVFDIDNPTIPKVIWDNLEDERFQISLSHIGDKPFCFWLNHSTNNQKDIFYYDDNAGKGFKLQAQCLNPITYTELVEYIFGFGRIVNPATHPVEMNR